MSESRAILAYCVCLPLAVVSFSWLLALCLLLYGVVKTQWK